MGEEEFGGDPRVRDHGNGVENYECDGCRMDTTFSSFVRNLIEKLIVS